MKRIVYNEKRKAYTVYFDKNNHIKQSEYSVNRYGELALKLAEKSFQDNRRYEDYFESDGIITTFYINTKAYGMKELIMDSEDAYMFYDKKISVADDKNSKTYYAKTKCGSVHRKIASAKSGDIVDHINQNGLDNRKCNLRLVNTSLNNKNATVRIDSKTGIKGVAKEGVIKYIAFWVDKVGKRNKRTFSILKYGEENAFRMAVQCRLDAEKENDYIPQECSETIENYIKNNIGIN